MPKIGKVKASCTDPNIFTLTVEEVDKLIALLETAMDEAEDASSEKWQGLVSIDFLDNRIGVATARIKNPTEETDD